MRDFFTELLLPRTDAGVFVQWGIGAFFWIVVLFSTRNIRKEYRTFIVGLFVANLAFFAIRSIH